ncbi:MAG TPA: hypothetical protein VK304_13515 [Thermoleophilaceae bacterium]|nr:hypothetical protein [Thermoleophilaceae bacterium]
MRLRMAIAAAAALAAVCAAPAEARRVALTKPTWQWAQGPSLAGAGVTWAEDGCRGGCDPTSDTFPDRFRLFRAGSGPRERIARVDGLRTRFDDDFSSAPSVRYGASADRVALLRSRFDRGPGTNQRELAELDAGPVGQPRELIFGCDGADPAQTEGDAPPLDQDDTSLAYDAASCGRPSRLAIRNLASGLTVQNAQPAGARLLLVRVAGPRAAVLRRLSSGLHELAVYSTASGAQLFSAPPPAGLAPEDVDVQADGTAAVVARARDDRCESGVLSWYSVVEPTEHRVDGVQPCPNGVRLAGGRAAVFTGTGEAQELRAHDLQAPDSQTLVLLRGVDHPSFRAPDGGPVPAFDFDGERVAYALRDCSDNQGLHLTAVARAPDAVSHVTCPVGLRSRRVAKPRRRRLALAVRCPRGCSGAATIRRGHVRLANTDYFSLGPNRRGRIRLIDEGAGRALRGRRRVGVRIAIRVTSRTGEDRPGIVRRGVLSR